MIQRRTRASEASNRWAATRFQLRKYIFCGLSLLPIANESFSKNGPWAIENSVERRWYGNSGGFAFGVREPLDARIRWSPDRRHFYFTCHHSELSTNRNISELFVYSAEKVMQSLSTSEQGSKESIKPLIVVSMRWDGQPKAPAIINSKWDEDGKTIEILAVNGDTDVPQYYLLDVQKRTTQQISNSKYQMQQVARRGPTLVYSHLYAYEVEMPYPVWEPSRIDFARAATGKNNYGRRGEIYVEYNQERRRLNGGYLLKPADISPNGKYAVVSVSSGGEVPEAWKHFDALDSPNWYEFWIVDIVGKNVKKLGFPMGSVLKRFENGTFSHFSSIMKSSPSRGWWSKDSQRVIIVNTTIGIDGGPELKDMAYIIGVDVETGEQKVLEPLADQSGIQVDDVQWVVPGETLLVTHSRNGEAMPSYVYSLSDVQWQREVIPSATASSKREDGSPIASILESQTEVPNSDDAVRVWLEESANEPPKVFASVGKNKVVLSSPDPALAEIRRAPIVEYRWTDSSGRTRVGGLMLPKSNLSDGKMPLVIQAGTYYPDRFFPDGGGQTAYAAQTLVAQGIAVLVLNGRESAGLPEEMLVFRDGAETAAFSLAERYGIDLSRVGIMGFSRMGYCTYWTITQPNRIRFAAAIIADSVKGTYSQYMTEYATKGVAASVLQDMEATYHSRFFEDKGVWFSSEPSFNTDRIRTPVLIADAGSPLSWAVPVVGALIAAGKPFVYTKINESSHHLGGPAARYASLQLTVDWMRFWLKGESPSDLGRAERWSMLRNQQDEVLKTPPPPKGKWVFQPDAEQPTWTPPTDLKPAAGSEKNGNQSTGPGQSTGSDLTSLNN